MTNHTTMVASWNKFRSIQSLRLKPKRRLLLNSISLHLLISFMWRNVYWFVLWSRTHNRHKIRYHNMIATNIFILFRNRFNNQTLSIILRDSFSHFSLSTSLLDKTSLASKSIFNIQTLSAFQENFQQDSYIFQPIYWIY